MASAQRRSPLAGFTNVPRARTLPFNRLRCVGSTVVANVYQTWRDGQMRLTDRELHLEPQ